MLWDLDFAQVFPISDDVYCMQFDILVLSLNVNLTLDLLTMTSRTKLKNALSWLERCILI